MRMLVYGLDYVLAPNLQCTVILSNIHIHRQYIGNSLVLISNMTFFIYPGNVKNDKILKDTVNHLNVEVQYKSRLSS